MDTKYLGQVALKVLSVLLVLAVLFYVCYHITGGFAPSYRTTPALEGEMEIGTEAEGVIFREEQPLSSRYGGAVNYAAFNGEKVKLNADVARVYATGSDRTLTERLIAIDEKIALLERSSFAEGVAVSTTDSIDERIRVLRANIFGCRQSGSYAPAAGYADELLVLLNQREIVTKNVSGYQTQIDALKAERARLGATLTGEFETVKAEKSGYFYYECDGFETVFLPSLLGGMTPAAFDELSSRPADTTPHVGKLVLSQKWYLALKVDRITLPDYTVGGEYGIAFPDHGDLRIPMTLQAANVGGDEALLVFSSNRMPTDFGYERQQSVRIIRETRTGLRFPASAIRLNDGVEGVYVLYGNTVFFRVTETVGTEDGYVYVRKDGEPYTLKEPDENGRGGQYWKPVALYDEVIVSGTGLYHGLIIN